MKKAKDGDLVFETTGRKLYVFGNMLSPNGPGEVCYGSDGGFPTGEPLTGDELREVAQYMIAEWQAWLLESLQEVATMIDQNQRTACE